MGEQKIAMEKEKLEMEERVAMEKENIQFQEKKKEREEKENRRQYQLEMKEIERKDKTKPVPSLLDPTNFLDVTKLIRLVPPFQEKKVSRYILHFEKVVENLKWPKSIGLLTRRPVFKSHQSHGIF